MSSNPSLVAVVDIETLGKGVDAVIGTIGIVIVDVAQLRVVDEFYCRVDLAQGRQRDDDTLAF